MTKGDTTKSGWKQKDKKGFADVWVQEQNFTYIVLIPTNHWERNCKRDQKLHVAIVWFLLLLFLFYFIVYLYLFDIEHVIVYIFYVEYIIFYWPYIKNM